MSFKKHDYRHDFEVACPYNLKHQMPFSKLWFHISKGCKDKREKGYKYDVCPYNSLHIVLKAYMQKHIMKCRYNKQSTQQENIEDDDIFAQMRECVQEQFNSVKPTIGSQSQISQVSSIKQVEQRNNLPNWSEDWDEQSEANDIEELNQISEFNYQCEEEEKQSQKQSSALTKSFQSSQNSYSNDDYCD